MFASPGQKPPHQLENQQPARDWPLDEPCKQDAAVNVASADPGEDHSPFHDFPRSLKIVLWILVFLSNYAQGLDSSTLLVYVNHAMAEFGEIVQYTTVITLMSVLLAASRGVFARLSDIFGRPALWGISSFCFIIGLVVVATATGFHSILAGIVFCTLGICSLALAQSLIMADLVPPRYRSLVTNLISLETFVNLVSAPRIAGKMIPDRWRWGVSISAFLLPATSIPIMVTLYYMQVRTRKIHGIQGGKYHGLSKWKTFEEFLLDVDPFGLLCFAGGFLLVLLPLTIVGLAPQGYHTPYIIGMIVTGGVLLILWPFVEMRVPRPLIQLRTFFLNPSIIVPALIYFIDEVTYSLINTPMLQWSEIVLGLSAGNATYLTYAQSASSTLFGILAGLITARTARYKWLTTAGACIRYLGLGLMYRYRVVGSSIGQVVVPQIIMGFGGGFMTANLIVAAQASVPYDQLAMATAFMYTVVPVGSSIGAAIVGAVQGGLLGELHKYVDPVAGNSTVAALIYAKGSSALTGYSLGTPIRMAAAQAWSENMQHLLKGALIVGALNILSTLLLPDNILASEKQAKGDEAFLPPLMEIPEGEAQKRVTAA